MRFLFRSAVLLALTLIVTASAMAQLSASLTGTVTTDGNPLPGVSVTASSPVLQGTRTTVSGENGSYSIAGLPPGDYTVTFELAGMSTVTKTTKLVLSTTSRVDASMKLTTVSEAISVTASAPAVMESTQVVSTFTAQTIEELPVARTVLAAALLAPGVNDNTVSTGQLSISGSPGYDNLIMVNGVAITENVRSQTTNLFIEDAIQETTVLTGAISAEYGRFTGGVVNSITKSGGNNFSGSFRDSLTNNDWERKTAFRDSAGNPEPDHVDKINEVYEATLGGFILRDRLWFFGSGRDSASSTSGSLSRSNIPYVRDTEERRIEGKLTGQITPKHSLVAAFLDRTSSTTNDFFSTVMDEASMYDREDPQSLKSAHYSGIITNDFLIEAHYADRKYGISRGGGSQFRDLIKGTLMLDARDGSRRFNSPTFCAACGNKDRNSEAYTLKANYFKSTSTLGSHNVVAGVERYSDRRFEPNNQSGSDFRVFVNGTLRQGNTTTGIPLKTDDGQLYPIFDNNAARTFIRWTPVFAAGAENNLTTNSAFVNDRWDLNAHWSFNLGIRYDMNDTVNADGDQVSDDSGFSPRLGAIFDPRGDGRHRISASVSRYQSRVVEGPATSGETAGQPGAIDFVYRGPLINGPGMPLVPTHQALQMMWDWFLGQGGTNNLSLLKPAGAKSVPGYDVVYPSGLKSPSVDEFVVGYGLQWGPTGYAKVDLVYRDWNDFYSFRVTEANNTVVDPLGIGHDLQIVENSNNIEREYRGVQFQTAYKPSFHQSRFNLGLNYTWSELEGNDTQESANSGVVGNDDPKQYYPEYLAFDNFSPIGYLGADQRHRLKAWVGYDLPLPAIIGRINMTVLHSYDSGLPYSAAGSICVDCYAGAAAPSDKLYYSGIYDPTYFFSERGAFRTPDIHRTDIGVNYSRNLFRSFEVFAQAEVLNVFDNDNPVSVNTTVRTYLDGGTFCGGKRCAAFNPFTDTPVEGVHWAKGTQFGQPTAVSSYQTPFTYRFSLGLRF